MCKKRTKQGGDENKFETNVLIGRGNLFRIEHLQYPNIRQHIMALSALFQNFVTN